MDIDDIFAAKGKGKIESVEPIASSSAIPKKKKKKKKQKQNTEPVPSQPAVDQPTTSSRKRAVPETFIDPSARISNTKRPKVASAKSALEPDDKKFQDSRGSGPRRKTEEGWSIYKEDELGIGDTGGDTPLCPFDCECCF
ncbi:hypothetical protein C8J56DRAFT_919417 [Mycena floridula]|nr:hypothetical protein C8J56DRAFT_919417 [Mycena floridula]